MKIKTIGLATLGSMLLMTSSCNGLGVLGNTNGIGQTNTQNDNSNSSQGGNILGNLLGNNDAGNILGNIIEGVFTQSKLEVSDLAGTWTSTGSAVSFKSENFLAQAGGIAAAGAIEAKLDPYYKQYGLTGAVFQIQPDGSFTLTAKGMSIGGTITKRGDGNFEFNFQALGLLNLGKLTAYVTKSGFNNMNIMFDATKLKSLFSTLAQFSGNQLANTAVSLLNSYDGMMVGFKLTKS